MLTTPRTEELDQRVPRQRTYQLEATVSDGVVTGVVQVPGKSRLSDMVNDVESFLVVREAALIQSETDAERSRLSLGTCLVGKDHVDFFSQPDEPATDPWKSDLRVSKRPQRVRITTRDFIVDANLYLPEGAELTAAVANSPTRFLPATDVTITPLRRQEISTFHRAFVLLNRRKIVVLTDLV